MNMLIGINISGNTVENPTNGPPIDNNQNEICHATSNSFHGYGHHTANR